MKKSVYRMFRDLETKDERSNQRRIQNKKRQNFILVNGITTPKRCTCGTCKMCLGNAKWDRIFNEKFATKTAPEYSPYGCALSNQ